MWFGGVMSRQLLQIAALVCFVIPVPALVVQQALNFQTSLEDGPLIPLKLSSESWQRITSPGTRHLLLNSRKHKLTFCMIPKNACSEFLALMMRVHGMSDDHYNPTKHLQMQGSIHWDPDREKLFFTNKSQEKSDFEAILNGVGDWKKAFFFRDPVERLVSSFISKVKTGFFRYMGVNNPFPTWDEMTLDEVVTALQNLGAQGLAATEPHVRPQSYLCGLNETLEGYSFVGTMENLASDAHEMLNLASAGNSSWASDMLDSGWGPSGTLSLFGVSRKEREGDMGMPSTNAQKLSRPKVFSVAQASLFHENNVAEQVAVQREMANMPPELRRRIHNLYHMDYALFERAKALGLTSQSGMIR